MFFNKKKYMKKLFCLYDIFFESNRNFTTKHVKIPGFLVVFVRNSSFFLISQIPGFFLPKLSNSRFFQVKWLPWKIQQES